MSQNETTSNGWDLIAAASQNALNTQLAKIPPVCVQADVPFKPLGNTNVAHVDITIHQPELQVKGGSGLTIPKGEKLIVTTQLTQIENKLEPHKGPKQTNYDLIIDFLSEDILVDMKLDIPAGDLAFLVTVLKETIKQHLKGGKEYKVASFALSNQDAEKYHALIPRLADFSFVKDPEKPGRSNLLVLMQTVSPSKGKIYFNKPLLASGQEFMVLISNQVFLQNFVMPAMIENVKKQAKQKDKVASQIAVKSLSEPYLYQVYNTQDINLQKDHDPWISSLTASVDTTEKALCFYLDVKADVTFADFRVETWDKSWQKFQIDEKQKITLKQTKEDKGKSTKAEPWEWLVAAVSWITLVILGVMYAVVENKNQDLGGTFVETAPLVVQWPNQKYVTLKSITTPNHVVLDLSVQF
ncbi:hypothetical protein AFCA_012133 [Aspergillus flavus]|nr:hypothetical protein AFCA_012133 [Aspergillus flavus]